MKRGPATPARRLWALPLAVLACTLCSVRSTPPREPRAQRRQIVELAASLVGIPYRFGGMDIDGFDCSGLVSYVYDCFGIRVPRSAREQGRMAGSVKPAYAAPGDILVFSSAGTWHSAIYMGDGRFVHAPVAGGWVRFENLNDYWLSRLRQVKSLWPRGR